MDKSFQKGFKLFNNGKFKRAIEKFTQSTADNPVNADVYKHIGLCYDTLGKYDRAIENFRKASDIHRSHGDEERRMAMDIHIADSLIHKGRYGEGEVVLRGIVNAKVRDIIRVEAASILALSLYHRGSCDEAIGILEEARLWMVGSVIEGETFAWGFSQRCVSIWR